MEDKVKAIFGKNVLNRDESGVHRAIELNTLKTSQMLKKMSQRKVMEKTKKAFKDRDSQFKSMETIQSEGIDIEYEGMNIYDGKLQDLDDSDIN